MSYLLSNNFNIGSMEERFLSEKLFHWDLVVKTNLVLERGGQMNLHVIIEVILIQFYTLHNNLMM